MRLSRVIVWEVLICMLVMMFSSLIVITEHEEESVLAGFIVNAFEDDAYDRSVLKSFANRWVESEYDLLSSSTGDRGRLMASAFFYYLKKRVFVHEDAREMQKIKSDPLCYVTAEELHDYERLSEVFRLYGTCLFGGINSDLHLSLLSDQYRYRSTIPYDREALFTYAEKTWKLIAEKLNCTKVPHQCTQYAAGVFKMIYGFTPTIVNGKDMAGRLLNDEKKLFTSSGELQAGTMYSIDATNDVNMSEEVRQYGHVGMILSVEKDEAGNITYLTIYDGNVMMGGVRNGYRWAYDEFCNYYRNCTITYAIPKNTDLFQEMKILMIGNSYTFHGSAKSVPTLLEELAAKNGRKITCDLFKRGGAGFYDFSHQYYREVVNALNVEKKYDCIFLQGNGTVRSMSEAMKKLLVDIRKYQPDATIYLYCTQPAVNKNWRNNNTRYRKTAMEYGLNVVYASDLADVTRKITRLRTTYEEDRNHPTWAGYYVAACAIYRKLIGTIGYVDTDLTGCELKGNELRRIADAANEMENDYA